MMGGRMFGRHRRSSFAATGILAISLSLCRGEERAAAEADLSGLVYEAFAGAMKKHGIPGGVVVIVRDGAVAFARGLGHADLERQAPVDPERTLFYLASVTKCFTATAVMQQVEQGRLDLERDVNDYLRHFMIPPTFSEPVTLRWLLTHTAGFDDRNIGYVARNAADALPMGEYLRRAMPTRVMPPGGCISYSNHGFGLAGYLVELASGLEFCDYLQRNVLNVLGMNHSTAHTPPPPELSAYMASMYFYNAALRRYEPAAPGYRNIPPAGTVWASGADMGRFLLAQLQGGAAGPGRILQEETVRRMHARQFSHHPALPGFAFGFYERFHAGMRILEHAGGYIGAATLLAILPEKNIGIFMAANQNTTAPHYAALQALLEGLAPATGRPDKDASQAPAGWPARARRFEGSYQNTRYSRQSVEKIAILDSQIWVAAAAEGTLALRPRNGSETRWVEVGPLLFRRLGSEEQLSFREDSGGRVTHLFMSLPGSALPSAFEKLSWPDTLAVQLPFMTATGAIFLSTFTLWPLAVLLRKAVRWLRGAPRRGFTAGKLPAVLAAGAGMLAVLFFAGLDQMLGNSQYRLRLVYGMTAEMTALLWIPILVTPLACLLGYFAAQSWRRRYWGLPTRIYYALVALAALLLIPFFWNWNLLGFRY